MVLLLGAQNSIDGLLKQLQPTSSAEPKLALDDGLQFDKFWSDAKFDEIYERDFCIALFEAMENAIRHGGGLTGIKFYSARKGDAVLISQVMPIPPNYEESIHYAIHISNQASDVLAEHLATNKGKGGLVLMHKLQQVKVCHEGNKVLIARPYTIQNP